MLMILHIKFLNKTLAKGMYVYIHTHTHTHTYISLYSIFHDCRDYFAEIQGWFNIQIQSDNPSYQQATEEKSYDHIN